MWNILNKKHLYTSKFGGKRTLVLDTGSSGPALQDLQAQYPAAEASSLNQAGQGLSH